MSGSKKQEIFLQKKAKLNNNVKSLASIKLKAEKPEHISRLSAFKENIVTAILPTAF